MTIAPLAVTIHRGASQVGGTCIELTSAGRRLVLDIGRPLDDAEVLIPPVAGLVGTRDPSLEGSSSLTATPITTASRAPSHPRSRSSWARPPNGSCGRPPSSCGIDSRRAHLLTCAIGCRSRSAPSRSPRTSWTTQRLRRVRAAGRGWLVAGCSTPETCAATDERQAHSDGSSESPRSPSTRCSWRARASAVPTTVVAPCPRQPSRSRLRRCSPGRRAWS